VSTCIYPLPLHDALPISIQAVRKRLIEAGVEIRTRLRVLADEDLQATRAAMDHGSGVRDIAHGLGVADTAVTRSWHVVMKRRIQDRKSTRLNSSHVSISY